MDSDSWISARLSASSRRLHSQSPSDLYVGGHEDSDNNVDDDFRAEFLCPFCAEDYDVVGLYCHIDEEHPLEAKNGVCPVCGKKILRLCQTGDFSLSLTRNYVQRKRRFRKGGSSSTYSILRKELREGALQSLFGGSSYVASSNSEPDPLLSSFIFNPVVADESLSVQPCSSVEATLVKESSTDDFLERKSQQLQLSDKDQLEKVRRFEFIQGLLMSTILDDK